MEFWMEEILILKIPRSHVGPILILVVKKKKKLVSWKREKSHWIKSHMFLVLLLRASTSDLINLSSSLAWQIKWRRHWSPRPSLWIEADLINKKHKLMLAFLLALSFYLSPRPHQSFKQSKASSFSSLSWQC